MSEEAKKLTPEQILTAFAGDKMVLRAMADLVVAARSGGPEERAARRSLEFIRGSVVGAVTALTNTDDAESFWL